MRVCSKDLKLRSNRQQKRATCFPTLLRNEFESYVARFTSYIQTYYVTNQVVASCVNTGLWLDKITRESRHTRELRHLLQNTTKFALGR